MTWLRTPLYILLNDNFTISKMLEILESNLACGNYRLVILHVAIYSIDLSVITMYAFKSNMNHYKCKNHTNAPPWKLVTVPKNITSQPNRFWRAGFHTQNNFITINMLGLDWSSMAPKDLVSAKYASANSDIRATSPPGCQTTHSPTHYGTSVIARSMPTCSSRACLKSSCHKCSPPEEYIVTRTWHAGYHSLLYKLRYGPCHRHAYNNQDVPDATTLQRTPYLFPAFRC